MYTEEGGEKTSIGQFLGTISFWIIHPFLYWLAIEVTQMNHRMKPLTQDDYGWIISLGFVLWIFAPFGVFVDLILLIPAVIVLLSDYIVANMY